MIAYGARVVSGTPRPGEEETTEVAWLDPTAIGENDINRLAQAVLRQLRLID